MKLFKLFLVVAVACLALNVIAQDTNAVPTTNVVNLPPAFEQVADLIGPTFKSWLTTLTVWIGSLSLLIAPFATRLEHWLRDRLNLIADNNESGVGTDVWLRGLFSNPVYKTVSTVLRFINVNFPTLKDLDRAVRLQSEAIAAAKITPKP